MCSSDLDLDEVEVGLLGKPERVGGGDDADGLAVGANEPDLRDADPVVDTKLGADVSSWWEWGRSPPCGPGAEAPGRKTRKPPL